jgi:bifunctional UDP-N-acetylglucosamine pyrophosphorylase / glucosamine-1-phosphate N-acetyltransferase
MGTTVYANSVIEDAMVGRNASVGPFARLRPGSVLGDETRVGNFVEVKNTLLKRGAKANHLAYLGDAEVGENCNIGAGTITCNYDGFLKHRTTIKEGAFIGSNSTLVAPVVIGESAYVGAGSTITKDVPDDALALSRGRQENKLGYAAKIRERLKAMKENSR